MAHHHFTRSDRVLLQKLKALGKNNAECARILESILAVLGVNCVGVAEPPLRGYSVRSSRIRSRRLRTVANQQHRNLFPGGIQSFGICVLLARCYSPEQIAAKIGLSHRTICRFLWSRCSSFLKLAFKFFTT